VFSPFKHGSLGQTFYQRHSGGQLMELDIWKDHTGKIRTWKHFWKALYLMNGILVSNERFTIYTRLNNTFGVKVDAFSNLFQHFIHEIVLVN
jgi:hypothetical protein